MVSRRKYQLFRVLCCLLLGCSNAVGNPALPEEITLPDDFASERHLIFNLHLEDGKAIPMIVDTGSPCTVLDESLASKLGKPVSHTFYWNFGIKRDSTVYHAPKLFLGKARLAWNNDWTLTADVREPSSETGHAVLGILGMDVLRNYCIQVDPIAHKVRVLTSTHLDRTNLGAVFNLIYSSSGEPDSFLIRPLIKQRSLLGGPWGVIMIDTGYAGDGAAATDVFLNEISRHLGSDHESIRSHDESRWFSQRNWNGCVYTNLLIGNGGTNFQRGFSTSSLGWTFLKRHLLTMDFPHRKLYLKQISVGPLEDGQMKSAKLYFNSLRQKGDLPEWSPIDQGAFYLESFYHFMEFDGHKAGGRFDYHYQIGRTSDGADWRLFKCWKSDETNSGGAILSVTQEH